MPTNIGKSLADLPPHSIDTGKGQTILNVSLSDSSKDLSIFLFYVLM